MDKSSQGFVRLREKITQSYYLDNLNKWRNILYYDPEYEASIF